MFAHNSGIGIHYGTSMITNVQYQAFAKNLIIGQRMIPQVLVRAADGRPYELQDLLPADARFKVLVFAGDTMSKAQLAILHKLADELEQILRKFVRNENLEDMFEILTIRYGT